MNYHNITKDDMLNGEGVRVVLWVSGCDHFCKNCQNKQTWGKDSGIPFDIDAKIEIFNELSKKHIQGITFSGGDPLAPYNRKEILSFIKLIKRLFPTKTIWCYTGYKYEHIKKLEHIKYIDVLVDGKFVEELSKPSPKWCGSYNQRVIDVKKSLKLKRVIIKEDF